MASNMSPDDEGKWRRHLGSDANNRGWALAEQRSRTPEEDDEMLDAAHAAAHLWRTIGTERNAALSHLLLGQVHALLGLASTADRYATVAKDYFTHHENASWELALAHAVAAQAAHCGGHADSHRAEYVAAERAMKAIADAEEREIVLATLRAVPRPQTIPKQG